jgi:hypothetical protein
MADERLRVAHGILLADGGDIAQQATVLQELQQAGRLGHSGARIPMRVGAK